MSLSGARSPRWLYQLLDSKDQPLGMLDREVRRGGSVEVSAQARLGGSAKISIDDRGRNIDFMSDRLQILYDPGVQDVEPWAIGTYLFTSPKEQHSSTVLNLDTGMQTKMVVLDGDPAGARLSVPEGTEVISFVKDLILSTGETRIALTESEAQLSSGLVFKATDSKLTIINKLLQAAGYWSLWTDGAGQYRVEPYIDISSRPIAHHFLHGEASLHMPDWSRTQDLSSVSNMFVARGQGDEETEPLVGIAKNENPESPFSYSRRGNKWFADTEEGVEAETQEAINAYAERRLRDAMNPVSKIEVTHAILPLEPNDLVEFIPEDGKRRLATVQKMTYKLDFNSDCGADWREVIPL